MLHRRRPTPATSAYLRALALAGLPVATHLPLMANSDHANFAAHGIPAPRLMLMTIDRRAASSCSAPRNGVWSDRASGSNGKQPTADRQRRGRNGIVQFERNPQGNRRQARRPGSRALQLTTTFEGALMSDGSVPEAARALFGSWRMPMRARSGSPPSSSRWGIIRRREQTEVAAPLHRMPRGGFSKSPDTPASRPRPTAACRRGHAARRVRFPARSRDRRLRAPRPRAARPAGW